jgi:hypothetical protein
METLQIVYRYGLWYVVRGGEVVGRGLRSDAAARAIATSLERAEERGRHCVDEPHAVR